MQRRTQFYADGQRISSGACFHVPTRCCQNDTVSRLRLRTVGSMRRVCSPVTRVSPVLALGDHRQSLDQHAFNASTKSDAPTTDIHDDVLSKKSWSCLEIHQQKSPEFTVCYSFMLFHFSEEIRDCHATFLGKTPNVFSALYYRVSVVVRRRLSSIAK